MCFTYISFLVGGSLLKLFVLYICGEASAVEALVELAQKSPNLSLRGYKIV